MSTNQESIDWYDKNAQNYTAHVRNPEDSIYHSLYEKPAMYNLLPDLHGKAVLSLGCGSGEDSNYLKAQGAERSVGIDISRGMIDIANQNAEGCEFKVMDMEHLDFPNGSFDFIYSSLAIHYIEDWSQVMKEAFRVLKPGGIFQFSCNHPVFSSLEQTENDETHYIRQLAKLKDKVSDEVTIIGNYMNRKSVTGANEFLVTTWTKPFGEIAAESTGAGFLIAAIVEPKPLEKMREVSPKDYESTSKIPDFVIFQLLKPTNAVVA